MRFIRFKDLFYFKLIRLASLVLFSLTFGFDHGSQIAMASEFPVSQDQGFDQPPRQLSRVDKALTAIVFSKAHFLKQIKKQNSVYNDLAIKCFEIISGVKAEALQKSSDSLNAVKVKLKGDSLAINMNFETEVNCKTIFTRFLTSQQLKSVFGVQEEIHLEESKHVPSLYQQARGYMVLSKEFSTLKINEYLHQEPEDYINLNPQHDFSNLLRLVRGLRLGTDDSFTIEPMPAVKVSSQEFQQFTSYVDKIFKEQCATFLDKFLNRSFDDKEKELFPNFKGVTDWTGLKEEDFKLMNTHKTVLCEKFFTAKRPRESELPAVFQPRAKIAGMMLFEAIYLAHYVKHSLDFVKSALKARYEQIVRVEPILLLMKNYELSPNEWLKIFKKRKQILEKETFLSAAQEKILKELTAHERVEESAFTEKSYYEALSLLWISSLSFDKEAESKEFFDGQLLERYKFLTANDLAEATAELVKKINEKSFESKAFAFGINVVAVFLPPKICAVLAHTLGGKFLSKIFKRLPKALKLTPEACLTGFIVSTLPIAVFSISGGFEDSFKSVMLDSTQALGLSHYDELSRAQKDLIYNFGILAIGYATIPAFQFNMLAKSMK